MRLVKLGLWALLLAALVSTGRQVWRGVTFDSEFAGLVGSARRGSALLDSVRLLAAERGIVLEEGFPQALPTPSGRTEVVVRYSIPVGVGPLSWVWHRQTSATTDVADLLGAPPPEATSPSPTPAPGMLGLPARVRQQLQGVGQ